MTGVHQGVKSHLNVGFPHLDLAFSKKSVYFLDILSKG